MGWEFLLPLAGSLISGFMGGGKNTSTTTPQLTPEMQAAISQIFGKINQSASKPYQKYHGGDAQWRVANPTDSRRQIDSHMPRIAAALHSPKTISAPNMVGAGGPSVGVTGGYQSAAPAMLPRQPDPRAV